METFTARVQRSESYWVAQLVEDPGVMTQTHCIEEIPDAIRDALALFPEFTFCPQDVNIQVTHVNEVWAGA